MDRHAGGVRHPSRPQGRQDLPREVGLSSQADLARCEGMIALVLRGRLRRTGDPEARRRLSVRLVNTRTVEALEEEVRRLVAMAVTVAMAVMDNSPDNRGLGMARARALGRREAPEAPVARVATVIVETVGTVGTVSSGTSGTSGRIGATTRIGSVHPARIGRIDRIDRIA